MKPPCCPYCLGSHRLVMIVPVVDTERNEVTGSATYAMPCPFCPVDYPTSTTLPSLEVEKR